MLDYHKRKKTTGIHLKTTWQYKRRQERRGVEEESGFYEGEAQDSF